MKLELFIFGITGFLIYDTYYEGKYSKLLLSYKKYYQIIIISVIALSFYLMIKKNPARCKNLLLYSNNLIKYMPIDKSSMDMISPIFDFTSKANNSFMYNYNTTNTQNYNPQIEQTKVLSGGVMGNKITKRSVSETKKKYVAYMQDWKCGECNNKLKHTFEVDHKIRLEYGGSNEPSNLVALCRECHGNKTALENM